MHHPVLAAGSKEDVLAARPLAVEIEEFVDLSQIDPVFFESSCYLTPAMCWTVPAVSATSSRRCSTVSRSFLCPEWRSATAARPG
ncbi:MAG: hypothetical protein ACE5EF_11345 [Dehalococcoidia bacterium]